MHWLLAGELTSADVRVYAELISELHRQCGYALLYADAVAGISVPSTARKEFTESFRERLHPSHTVVIGANTLVRALGSLIIGSTKLLHNQRISVDFLNTEAEGLERLAAVRAALRAALPSSG